MKKALSVLLVLVMSISLCACNSYNGLDPNDYMYNYEAPTTTQNTTSGTETMSGEDSVSNSETNAAVYNVLYGKSLICLGDSITYGSGLTDRSKVWGNLIAERNGMSFTNAGISGSTMGESVDGKNTNASYKNNRHLAIEGHDYALIWFGWNDHAYCKLGTYDGTDETTTLVAYRLTLEYIIKNYPETKVGVIIPYLWEYNDDPQGHGIMEMMDGIKEVCDLSGVPYLDLPKYNFLPCWGSDYPNNEQYYKKWDAKQKVFTTDTLHPNEKGNEYLSTIIEGFLRTL